MPCSSVFSAGVSLSMNFPFPILYCVVIQISSSLSITSINRQNCASREKEEHRVNSSRTRWVREPETRKSIGFSWRCSRTGHLLGQLDENLDPTKLVQNCFSFGWRHCCFVAWAIGYYLSRTIRHWNPWENNMLGCYCEKTNPFIVDLSS